MIPRTEQQAIQVVNEGSSIYLRVFFEDRTCIDYKLRPGQLLPLAIQLLQAISSGN